jgi:tetratricopeptide (TPR) repeat protein
MIESRRRCRPAPAWLVIAACLFVWPAGLPCADTEGEDVAAAFERARRLTWKSETRSEGIAALRELTTEHPGRLEIAETLAEVLSWSTVTRPEAVDRLRRILAADPERNSTRLILAEVLSWSRETRPESEELYADVLRRDPDSVEARVGLARLHSWRGEMDRAETLYREAIAGDPEGEEARLGLAEVQRWSGRPRASLETLAELPPASRDSVAARRHRAKAYRDLDRPALALAEYEALLSSEPDDEEALRETRSLRRRLRPRLEIGLAGSTESGDPRTSKLETVGLPASWTVRTARDLEYKLRAGAWSFDNDRGSTRRLSAGGGLDTPLGDRLVLQAAADLHDFEEADTEVTGRLVLAYAPLDRLKLRVGFDRDLLYDSRLSAAGEETAGIFYGPVLRDDLFIALSCRPGPAWDLWVRGSTGSADGTNVEDNDREAVFAGFGRSFRWAEVWLRPGYTFGWMSYDKDLSGFPPADLGGDGLDSPGLGGYFSPFRWVNHMVRLDVTWPGGSTLDWRAGVGVGRQEVEDTGTDGSDDRTSSEAYLGLRWRLTEDLGLRGEVTYQDVAGAFDRTRAGLYLIRLF